MMLSAVTQANCAAPLHSYLFLSLPHILLYISLLILDLWAMKKKTQNTAFVFQVVNKKQLFTPLWAEYCSSDLLVLFKQCTGLLKYVFSLSLCVACCPTLCLPGSGNAKHTRVQRQHCTASWGRHQDLESVKTAGTFTVKTAYRHCTTHQCITRLQLQT